KVLVASRSFVMLGLECRGDAPAEWTLVVTIPWEDSREATDILVAEASHRCHNQTRVESAREERPDRYVSNEPAAHRFQQRAFHLRDRLLEGQGRRRSRVGCRPVTVNARCPGVEVELEPGAGRKLFDSAEQRIGRRNAPEGEVIRQLILVEFSANPGKRDQRFRLGRKEDSLVSDAVVELFYAQTITSQPESSADDIEEGESPHSIQLRQ